MNRKIITKAQHAVLLEEISRNAFQVIDLAQKTQDAASEKQCVASLTTAIEHMVQRIGWLAERATEGLGLDSVCGGDANLWFLPAAFNAASEPANTTGSEDGHHA